MMTREKNRRMIDNLGWERKWWKGKFIQCFSKESWVGLPVEEETNLWFNSLLHPIKRLFTVLKLWNGSIFLVLSWGTGVVMTLGFLWMTEETIGWDQPLVDFFFFEITVSKLDYSNKTEHLWDRHTNLWFSCFINSLTCKHKSNFTPRNSIQWNSHIIN